MLKGEFVAQFGLERQTFFGAKHPPSAARWLMPSDETATFCDEQT
jgi:hypothetical protein